MKGWKIDKFNVMFSGKQYRFIAVFDQVKEDYVRDRNQRIHCIIQ